MAVAQWSWQEQEVDRPGRRGDGWINIIKHSHEPPSYIQMQNGRRKSHISESSTLWDHPSSSGWKPPKDSHHCTVTSRSTLNLYRSSLAPLLGGGLSFGGFQQRWGFLMDVFCRSGAVRAPAPPGQTVIDCKVSLDMIPGISAFLPVSVSSTCSSKTGGD